MALTVQQSYLLGTTPPTKPTVAPAILRRRVMTEQPQFAAEIDVTALGKGAIFCPTTSNNVITTATRSATDKGVVWSSSGSTYSYADTTLPASVSGITMLVVVRFKSAISGGSYKTLCGRADSGGYQHLGFQWDHAGSSLYRQAWQCNNGSAWTPVAYSDLTNGQWYVLSASRSANELRIYKNGRFVNSASVSGFLSGVTGKFPIGVNSVGTSFGTSYCDADVALILELPEYKSDSWHAKYGQNPYQIFRAPNLTPWVAV